MYITIPKGRKRSIVRKYWTKARPKPNRANSKFSISDVKSALQSSTSFQLCGLQYICLPCAGSTLSTQLSLLGSRDSGLSNILESPVQSRLPRHSFTQWPLQASTQGHPYHSLGPMAFLRYWQIPRPLFYNLDFKARTTWLKLTSATCWNWDKGPPFSFFSISLLFSMVSFNVCLSF